MNAPILFPAEVAEAPIRRRWNCEEYARLVECDLFRSEHVELIGGEILVMAPQSWAHFAAVHQVVETLRAAFAGKSYVVAQQPSILVMPNSQPEPDVAVLSGRLSDYANVPQRAELIVEVALSSLDFDRRDKSSLYASAGMPDYWIVNLRDRRLEVRRQPIADPSMPFGWSYAELSTLNLDGHVTPLVLANARIAVAQLFPPQAVHTLADRN